MTRAVKRQGAGGGARGFAAGWLLVAAAFSPALPAQEVTQGGSVAPADTLETSRHLIRAHFTSGVVEREPVDRIDQIDTSRPRVYFFSEFSGLAGRVLAHRWEYEGRLMAEVRHHIGADRWRAWSSKRLLPQWEGAWSVSVVDEEGDTLRTETLLVVPPGGG